MVGSCFEKKYHKWMKQLLKFIQRKLYKSDGKVNGLLVGTVLKQIPLPSSKPQFFNHEIKSFLFDQKDVTYFMIFILLSFLKY